MLQSTRDFLPNSLLASLVILSCCASVRGHGLGVGIIAGNPTGVSAKKWLCDCRAIDAAAAWSFDDHDSLQLHADYLWHHHVANFSEQRHGWMPVYTGVGGRVGFEEGNGANDDETRAGVRVPVGVSYLANTAPVEVFFEVVPTLDVAPRTDLELDAAAGVRFYFR